MTRHRRDRADEIVLVIREYTAAYGFAPSIRDIAQRVGLASTSAVDYHIRALAMAGRIVYERTTARSLRVVEDRVDEQSPDVCPTCHRALA